jgi:hypothetical protein
MNQRRAGWLAWGLFGLCVVGTATQTFVLTVSREEVLAGAAFAGAFLCAPGVGALIAARQPGNAVGWLLLASGTLFQLAAVSDEYLRHAAETQDRWSRVDGALGLVSVGLFFSIFYVLGTLVPLVFPNGKLLSRRWKLAELVGGLGILLVTLGIGLHPDELGEEYGLERRNPLSVESTVIDAAPALGLVALMGSAVAAWTSLAFRFRRSSGEERQQLKWFALAATLAVTTLAITGASWIGGARSLVFDIVISVALLALMPAAIGVAILRYRLYDIDVIINRALVYGALTLATVASYVSLVVGMSWVLRTVLGQGSNELAVAVTTLMVAALIQPARRGIQSIVDRRFYRSRYDAVRTMEAFQVRLRDETDLRSLHRSLVHTIDETVRPAHVFVWLRNETLARNDLGSPDAYRYAGRGRS